MYKVGDRVETDSADGLLSGLTGTVKVVYNLFQVGIVLDKYGNFNRPALFDITELWKVESV